MNIFKNFQNSFHACHKLNQNSLSLTIRWATRNENQPTVSLDSTRVLHNGISWGQPDFIFQVVGGFWCGSGT